MADNAKSRFKFTDEQWNEIAEPAWHNIDEQLKDLQKETGCPNSTILGLLKSLELFYEEEKQDIQRIGS